jgi:outer membrane protein assembly factor BamB
MTTQREPAPLCLLLALACGGEPAPDTATPGTDTSQPVAALAEGPQGLCVQAADLTGDAVSGLSAGGVARVTWDDPGAASWLRVTDALGRVRDLPRDDRGGATARAAPADADLVARLVVQIGAEGLACADPISLRTSPLPVGFPELALTLGGPEAVSPGYFVTPVLTADRRFVAVVATTGEVVWAWEPPTEVSPDSPLYRAAPTRDGGGVFTQVHATKSGPGTLWRARWDGTLDRTIEIDGLHRDFTELPDGSVAALAYESRELDSGPLLRGDRVVVVAPDGTQAEAWNMFDDFDHGLGDSGPVDDPDDDRLREWAHANGLTYDAATDAWLITLPQLGPPDGPRPQGSLVAIDRATRQTRWELSHQGGDFEIAPDDAVLYQAPHSMQATQDGVLVFSRGAPETCSQAVEIALDGGVARAVWSSDDADCTHVVFLGEATRRADGDTVVMYSSAGRLDVVDGDGQPLWRLETDLGAAFGFVDVRDALDGAAAR